MQNTDTRKTIEAQSISRGQIFLYGGLRYKATNVRVLQSSVTVDVEGAVFGISFTRNAQLEIL